MLPRVSLPRTNGLLYDSSRLGVNDASVRGDARAVVASLGRPRGRIRALTDAPVGSPMNAVCELGCVGWCERPPEQLRAFRQPVSSHRPCGSRGPKPSQMRRPSAVRLGNCRAPGMVAVRLTAADGPNVRWTRDWSLTQHCPAQPACRRSAALPTPWSPVVRRVVTR